MLILVSGDNQKNIYSFIDKVCSHSHKNDVEYIPLITTRKKRLSEKRKERFYHLKYIKDFKELRKNGNMLSTFMYQGNHYGLSHVDVNFAYREQNIGITQMISSNINNVKTNISHEIPVVTVFVCKGNDEKVTMERTVNEFDFVVDMLDKENMQDVIKILFLQHTSLISENQIMLTT